MKTVRAVCVLLSIRFFVTLALAQSSETSNITNSSSPVVSTVQNLSVTPDTHSFGFSSTVSPSAQETSLNTSSFTPILTISNAFTSQTVTTSFTSLPDGPSQPTTVTSSSPAPTQSTNSSASTDIDTILERRLTIILNSITDAANIQAWLSTLQADGSWPASEVDYTTGCEAQRANWPAQVHWRRIMTMAAAFHGGIANASQWVNSSELLSAISSAMDFWFSNDMANDNCIDSGGRDACPCGTPGFWNTNWFSYILGIPEFTGKSCLLVNSSLTPTQVSNCTHISRRAYDTFNRPVVGLGTYTGANTLDLASIGIDLGLFTSNASLIADAYARVHNEVVIQQNVSADGIRPDGSFGQHGGIIYNGNYGKDYANTVFELEIAAAETQFQADTESREAFETLIDGDLWMIYRNVLTGVLHWDFSALGRFISFPVIDDQATGSIKMNITQMDVLGGLWNSETLGSAFETLSENSTTANVGDISGNRMFYNNDYMVHRGPGYVSTLRMYSSRTKNTECTNSQNPFGFHLSDGTVYTYLEGSEYEDIAAAWDWNLIPGITVDYNATTLACESTDFIGVESFVGGASTGRIGVGAMRYTNPSTQSLRWQKAWFFLDDNVQHVLLNNLSSATDAPIFSVLDQRKHATDIFVDGRSVTSGNFSQMWTLWHGNVGYTFPPNPAVSLSVDSGPRTGNWSSLGISTQPPPTVDMFAAWLAHTNTNAGVSYTAFPAVDYQAFLGRAAQTLIVDVQNDANVSTILDVVHKTAMIVFWGSGGGVTTIPPLLAGYASISVSSNKGLLVILEMETWNITVADPTQSVSNVEVTFKLDSGKPPSGWSGGDVVTVPITLPTLGLAGSSVSAAV